MKKVFYAAFLLIIGLLVFDGGRRTTVVSAQSNAPVQAQREQDRQLAEKIRELTNRRSDDLPASKSADGAFFLDLDERFQNVMLARTDEDGEPAAACATSLNEANAFFGRDLETGALVPSAGYRPGKAAKVAAAAHGMSVAEYEFYSKLIAQAQQQVNSPTAAIITIVNGDGAGEGFNDPTAKDPEGGNAGTTLGEQRLNLFNFAAGIWGAYLDSSVPIAINSQFNSLTPCTTSSAVLGSAGSASISRDFPNAPISATWYPTALAAKLSGADRNGTNAEINARFNSDIDTGCFGTRRFYYGFDNVTPAGRVNLLVVLLHEMGHGLGFQSFVNGSTGVLAGDDTNGRYPDVFMRYLYDRTSGKYWHQMTDAERQASAFNSGNVLWDGANVKIASGFLTSGREASTGRVQMYAPDPYSSGSSVSHWDTAATPNLLMEPNVTANLPLTLDLTRQLMRDIGWYRDTTADLTPDTIINVQTNVAALVVGSQATVTWTNTGGFNRNVTVEISFDGGATFTTLASNTANTGSFTFTVPNTSTAQGRIRVREFDFVAPSGLSTNFSIGSTPVARRTAFDFDGDGRADLSVFRPSTGHWFSFNQNTGNSPFYGVPFGSNGDRSAPADFDGDGKTDIAVYRPSEGGWYIQRSRDGFFGARFGTAEDIPAPADYDGDGRAEIAVYRPSEGNWYMFNLTNNSVTGARFGLSGDVPVAADYDGDGRADIALFRPSEGNWYIMRSRDGFFGARWGVATDKPVVGDYDGDGRSDLAVFRPAEGNWYVQQSRDGFSGVRFGVSTDLPVAADYDGDGKTDIAVFRPSDGDWYLLRSRDGLSTAHFGSMGDRPSPNSFVP